MYLNGYEKGWPLFCPFKPNWWVHSNISGIFEQFSIRLCVKNMKTQETFKKKSGHTPVLCVRKYFLISALGASINDVYKNKGGGGLECIYWWRHCYYVDEGGRGSENCPNLVDVIYGRSLLETDKHVPQWLWKSLAIVLSLQTKLVSAQQYFWHLWTIFY